MFFFRLHIDCYFVTGVNGSVLYDLTGRRIFILDAESGSLLSTCESNMPLVKEHLSDKANDFLNTLAQEGLGNYHSHPMYIDKLLLASPINDFSGLLAVPPQYMAVSWSITDQCNLNCKHCPSSLDHPLWLACRSCLRHHGVIEDPALYDDSEHILKQIADLGVRELHIRGGNPLLKWDRLQKILFEARKYPNLHITITTPGIGSSVDDIFSLYNYHTNLTLNITLIGCDVLSNETSILNGTAFQEQCAILDALHNRGVHFLIVVIIDDDSQIDMECVSRQAFDRWGTTPSFAEFHWMPGPNKKFRFERSRKNAKNLYIWKTVRHFFHMTQRNACLCGGFEIALDGTIRPCVGCGHVCGKINGNILIDALKGNRLYDIWDMNKDTIEYCNNCALRYACIDCLAAEMLGMKDKAVASGYCPVMCQGDLYENADRFKHRNFLHRLSIEKGIH